MTSKSKEKCPGNMESRLVAMAGDPSQPSIYPSALEEWIYISTVGGDSTFCSKPLDRRVSVPKLWTWTQILVIGGTVGANLGWTGISWNQSIFGSYGDEVHYIFVL